MLGNIIYIEAMIFARQRSCIQFQLSSEECAYGARLQLPFHCAVEDLKQTTDEDDANEKTSKLKIF